MNMGRVIPTRAMMDNYKINLGDLDVIWQPLFDYQSYGTQGNTQFTFFNNGQGQGTTSAFGATGAKTIADTNMPPGGSLGKGNRQMVTGVEVVLYPGGIATQTFGPGQGATTEANTGRFTQDVWTISKGGVLVLTAGSDRKYVEDGPITMFPPVTRLAIAAAIATTFNATAASTATLDQIDYAACSGEPYSIAPLFIDETQQFTTVINFPVAIAPPSAIAPRIGVRLRGYRIRNAQ
jgi:hypothetical protein